MSVPGAPARTINGCGVSWSSVQTLPRSKETSQSKHEAFHFLILLGTHDSIAMFLSLVVSVFWAGQMVFQTLDTLLLWQIQLLNYFSWLKENSKLQGPDWLEAAGMLSRSGSNAANQWSNPTHTHNGWYHRKMEVLPVAVFDTRGKIGNNLPYYLFDLLMTMQPWFWKCLRLGTVSKPNKPDISTCLTWVWAKSWLWAFALVETPQHDHKLWNYLPHFLHSNQ